VDRAADKMKAVVDDPRVDQVAARDPEVAKQVADAVKALAKAPGHGLDATNWMAAHLGTDPSGAANTGPYAAYFDKKETDETTEHALETLAADPETASDPAKALNQALSSLQAMVWASSWRTSSRRRSRMRCPATASVLRRRFSAAAARA